MQNMYRQYQLKQMSGPRNPELHEMLNQLPDPTDDILNEFIEQLNCGEVDCTIEVERCVCDDPFPTCPAGPSLRPMPQDDPYCYCEKETIHIDY